MLAIAWKELIQLRRDALTLVLIIALPVSQLLLFGWAINTDVRHLPMVVLDQDHSGESRELARTLAATDSYVIVGNVRGYDEIAEAFKGERARVALVVPAGFSMALHRGEGARAQLVLDGVDPQTVMGATTTATQLASVRSTELMLTRLAVTGATTTPIAIEPTVWYNPELRTATYIVPGLIGAILTIALVMLTAMAIARERERGTLEQLIVSPVGRAELVLGKILPYILIGYVQMTLVLAVGNLVFRVPVVGSIMLLYVLASVFVGANLALGIFFSTLAKTQQQAMQLSYFFLLPNILLSGFLFPIEGMPIAAQWIAEILPLTHFLRITRGITLRGSGFVDVAGDVAWLAGIFVALLVLASLRFRKKLL